MEVFHRLQCVIVLMMLVDFGRTDVYPSIQWTHMNPVFKRNRTQCVYPQSKLYFVCPNTATIVTRLQSNGSPRPQYENLWLVSKQGYDRCEVNKTVDRSLIVCDKPFNLLYYRVTFMKYSPGNEPEFKPGKDYYFIATSDGSKSSTNNVSGGHCRTHNMKLKFRICMNNTDPLCQSDESCNGLIPTRTTTAATKTTKMVSTPQPTGNVETTHSARSTSLKNYTITSTTMITTAGNPKNERNMSKERPYLIAIGILVFICVFLFLTSVLLLYRLTQKRKREPSLSLDGSASSHDCRDGDWGYGLLLNRA